jgi:predicted nucleic acid-binding Zn ribbon protein
VFYFKGVSPRTWHEQEKARRSMRIYMLVWIMTLLALVLVLYLRESI